jgi:hypothetical protein
VFNHGLICGHGSTFGPRAGLCEGTRYSHGDDEVDLGRAGEACGAAFSGMGVQPRVDLRARFYFRTTGGTMRGHSLRAGVCRRFLCFVSFSPLEKEMKCRHAQWLIVISKKIRHITRSGKSRTARAPSPTANGHRPPTNPTARIGSNNQTAAGLTRTPRSASTHPAHLPNYPPFPSLIPQSPPGPFRNNRCHRLKVCSMDRP